MIDSFKVSRDEMYEDGDMQCLYSTLFVTLFTTRLCNVNCEYCDVIYRDHTNNKMVSVEEFSSLLNCISQDDRPNVNLHFFGGEPTLNPSLKEFVSMAKEKLEDRNLNMLLTTNLSRSETYYETLGNVKIVASFHSDYVEDHDAWYVKAKDLNRAGMLHHAVIMVTEKNMDYIYVLYEKWSKDFKCVLVPIDRIYDTEIYAKYKESIIGLLDHNPFEHDEEYVNFFDKDNPKNTELGVMCSSGIVVDESGNVNYCFPRLGETVFNVFENPEHKLSQFHFCNSMGCRCDLEIIRSSVKYYNETLKNRPYTVNNKVMVQCNA